MASIGLEMEMPVIDKTTGALHLVKDYFQNLERIKNSHGSEVHLDLQGGRPVSVVSDDGVSSVDNGFNNLESALGPVAGGPGNLQLLSAKIDKELQDVSKALALENASVVNFSQHPNTLINREYYFQARTPRPIYDYWVNHRNWNHPAGIDAKAHNGPTTGISFPEAIAGLNVLVGLSAAFIAFFANSPFVGGVPNGIKENRQILWEDMFATSQFSCDRKLCRIPDKPFSDLRDYFQWMFGAGTRMQAIMGTNGGDYKKPSELLRVVGDPSLLEFLQQKKWSATVISAEGVGFERQTIIQPDFSHFEFLQFSQFLDARIRYQLLDKDTPLELLIEAFSSDGKLEELFESISCNVYLEGRAAGANFPDDELTSLADHEIVRSVVISPSALQFGLLANSQKACQLVDKYGWQTLIQLREAAIKDGLHGIAGNHQVEKLCQDCVSVAAEGLASDQQWMLAYPLHILKTRENGADRALAAYEKDGGSRSAITNLLLRRKLVLP